MPKAPAYIEKFRELVRAEPKFTDIEALEQELYNSQSDRATVIMFGSFVEAHLERLLLSVMRSDLTSTDRKQLFEYEGAAGTFASKIIMVYGLKLIGPVSRRDLDLIRHLRNGFAHSRMTFSFATKEVHAVCEQLKIIELPGSSLPSGYIRRAPNDKREAVTDVREPKTRFIGTCHTLSYRMIEKTRGYPQAGDYAYPDNEPLP